MANSIYIYLQANIDSGFVGIKRNQTKTQQQEGMHLHTHALKHTCTLSLSLSHTHTHTRTCIHVCTHTPHTHFLALAFSLSLSLILILSPLPLPLSLFLSLSRSLSLSLSLSQTTKYTLAALLDYDPARRPGAVETLQFGFLSKVADEATPEGETARARRASDIECLRRTVCLVMQQRRNAVA